MQQSNRDTTIDILRGVAIVTMVCANSAAYILREPHPLGIRLYGTWAAPLFILLAGFMVAFTAQKKKYELSHYILRGGLLLLCACLLDVLNFNSYPLIGWDVLYLIAVATPLAFGFHKLKLLHQVIIITAIILLTPLLQNWLDYREQPLYIQIFPGEEGTDQFDFVTVIKHWFIDGWFPIFPWVSFSFIGVILARLRLEYPSFAQPRFTIAALASLGSGLGIWFVELQKLPYETNLPPYMPGFAFHKLLTREHYTEMFYPPTIGYCLVALGLIITLFILVDLSPQLFFYKPIMLLGQCSLFMYLFHYTFIEKVLSKLVPEEEERLAIDSFLLVYLAFLLGLNLVALGISAIKQKWQSPPYLAKFLLGG
jgi:uncharacterized membrane protein